MRLEKGGLAGKVCAREELCSSGVDAAQHGSKVAPKVVKESAMSASGGREYLAIPGPSVMPDAVLRAMHRASPNIYAGELPDMMPELISGLKAVARTEHNATIYIANGHGAWEAALSNILAEGDQAL